MSKLKANLRFIFTVVLLFCVSAFVAGDFISQKKAQFEGDGVFYTANNPKGIDLNSSELFEKLGNSDGNLDDSAENGLNAIAKDSSGKLLYSNFSSFKLSEGRVPQAENEFIAPENGSNKTKDASGSNPDNAPDSMTGRYKQTLSTNELGNVYRLQKSQNIKAFEITFNGEPTESQKDFIGQSGFVRINSQNIDRKIDAESYNLIGLILQTFSAVLMFMAIVSWLCFLIKTVNDSQKRLTVLKSFGATDFEASREHVRINRKALIRVSAEFFVIFNLAAFAAKSAWKFNRFAVLNLTWGATVLAVLLSVLIAVMIKFALMRNKWQFNSKIPLIAAVILACAVGLKISKPIFVFAAFAAAALISIAKKRFTIVRSLYSQMGAVCAALIAIVAMMIAVTAVGTSLIAETSGKEDKTIETTMPYETQIVGDSLPEGIDNPEAYHHYAYINPVNGVTLNSKQVYPLIYSTDLSRYRKYMDSDKPTDENSVVIGRVLARKANASVGSEIEFNGQKMTVTHIVDSEHYAGMIIYLPNSLFERFYGSTGNSFYYTDLPRKETEAYFDSKQILDREENRALYKNSASELLAGILIFCTIIMFATLFLTLKMFAVFINFIMWKLNLTRAFGMSFTEYAGSVYLQFASIFASAMAAVSVIFVPMSNYLTGKIFDNTDAYIPISCSAAFFIVSIAETVILIGWTAVGSYRKIVKKSIYEQYLETVTES